jgi:tRNA-specific 2-thiouridylase
MQLWDYSESATTGAGPTTKKFGSCCSLSDVNDARIVSYHLGFPHYLINYEKEFRAGVVDYFAESYAQGKTPNPCVMCNSKLKFNHLIEQAKKLGADMVATGHYADIRHDADGTKIFRAQDLNKDQTYFLFHLKRESLKHIMFPLARYTKDQIRAIADRYNLVNSQKKDSQEICFVGNRSYGEFLTKHYPAVTKNVGLVKDRQGNVLGEHQGIHLFTVGQRKGLNVYGPKPRYVAEIVPSENTVIIDELEGLKQKAFVLEMPNWLHKDLSHDDEVEGEVVIRYRSKGIPAKARYMKDGRMSVELLTEAPWITPGQAAVFYAHDQLLGGGFIGAPLRDEVSATESRAMDVYEDRVTDNLRGVYAKAPGASRGSHEVTVSSEL